MGAAEYLDELRADMAGRDPTIAGCQRCGYRMGLRCWPIDDGEDDHDVVATMLDGLAERAAQMPGVAMFAMALVDPDRSHEPGDPDLVVELWRVSDRRRVMAGTTEQATRASMVHVCVPERDI